MNFLNRLWLALTGKSATRPVLTAIYDQAASPAVAFVGEAHYFFLEMVADVAEQRNASRIVVGPTALTVLQSGNLPGKEYQFIRATTRTIDSSEIVVGHINGAEVVVDQYLNEAQPVMIYKDKTLVGRVDVISAHLRFI